MTPASLGCDFSKDLPRNDRNNKQMYCLLTIICYKFMLQDVNTYEVFLLFPKYPSPD